MNKIKLNNLSARMMSEKQMDVVNGGEGHCGCSCYYMNQGGASILDNYSANNLRGIPKSRRGNTRMEDFNHSCIYGDEVIIKP